MAVDARVAEEVLVLQERAVAPTVDLHREQVLAGLEILRDVELVRGAAVLGEAHPPAVHPYVVRGIDALETQEYGPPLPRVRHRERGAVGRDGVVVLVHVRRRVGVRIDDVAVDRDAEPLQLDAARHLDRVPRGVVEIWAEEVERTLSRRAAPVVLPLAVQRLHVWRLGEVVRERGLHGRERKRVCARRLHVHVVYELVRPFGRFVLLALRLHGGERRLAHVGPLRTVVDAQVLPLEAPCRVRDRLQEFVDEVPQRSLRARHVGTVDADDAVAQADRPGPLRRPRLGGHEEVARERRRVAQHFHLHACHALHLLGELAHHGFCGGRLVRAVVDAERTRVVTLDRESLCRRARRQEQCGCNQNAGMFHAAIIPHSALHGVRQKSGSWERTGASGTMSSGTGSRTSSEVAMSASAVSASVAPTSRWFCGRSPNLVASL